jgi:Putative beta-barrel porin 2
MNLKLAITLGTGIMLCSQSALAQDANVRRINVSVSSSLNYDDNVLRQADGIVDPRGFAREDFRFSPSINVDIFQPVGRAKLTLLGGAGYDFYRKNAALERERINLRANADVDVGPDCSSQASLAYARQQSDLAELIVIARLRNRETTRMVSLGARCGSVIGLKPSVSVEFSDTKNSSIFRETGDFKSAVYNASLGYLSPVVGEASVYGNYRRGTYPNRGIFTGQAPRDPIDVYNFGVRFNRDIGVTLKGNVSVGYTIVNPSTVSVQRFRGLSGSADITWQPLEQLQVLLGFSRTVQQSNILNVSFSINDRFRASASYILSPTLRISSDVTRTSRKLRSSSQFAQTGLGNNERSTALSGGLRYTPLGPIAFTLDATRVSRSSSSRIFDFTGNSVTLGVIFNLINR